MEGGHKLSFGTTHKVSIKYMKDIVVDFKEGLDYYVSYYESIERGNLEESVWTKEETDQLYMKAQHKLWNEEIYTPQTFFRGMTECLSLSISDALNHEEWMVRLFSILDKRCGKRTLIKLCDVINTYPKMLRKFYTLRLDNEGIAYNYDGEGNLVLTKRQDKGD
jgi:hypothetical protein